jgi:hypothetical protein
MRIVRIKAVAPAEVYRRSLIQTALASPTAGVSTVLMNGSIIVIGGESAANFRMHTDVEALNLATLKWTTLAPLIHGRHGTEAILHQGKIYIAAGSSREGAGDRIQEVFTPESQ